VTVTAYLAKEEKIEAARRRKRDEACVAKDKEGLKYPDQPEWNRGDFGEKKDCLSCFQECSQHSREGKWPEYKCPSPN